MSKYLYIRGIQKCSDCILSTPGYCTHPEHDQDVDFPTVDNSGDSSLPEWCPLPDESERKEAKAKRLGNDKRGYLHS